MKAKEFEEVNVRIAENQDEYATLPSFYNKDDGTVTMCFELSDDEMNRLHATNELWFKVYTGGNPLQPIALSTNKEEII